MVLQVWWRVVKHGLVTLVVIMILKHTATFQVLLNFLYSVFGTSLLWRLTVAFTYLKVKSTKYLCLLPVVLVLLFWSWSWSCKQRSWVLVLRICSCLHHWLTLHYKQFINVMHFCSAQSIQTCNLAYL